MEIGWVCEKYPLVSALMLSIAKSLVAACIFLMLAASASINAAAPGFLEGHLKIGSLSSNIIKPADVLTQTLQERKERTTLHLSKYCQNASENLEKSDGDLCLTGPGVDVARIRSSLWPETTQAPRASAWR